MVIIINAWKVDSVCERKLLMFLSSLNNIYVKCLQLMLAEPFSSFYRRQQTKCHIFKNIFPSLSVSMMTSGPHKLVQSGNL